jgi:hypothetical protein
LGVGGLRVGNREDEFFVARAEQIKIMEKPHKKLDAGAGLIQSLKKKF